MSRHSFSPHWKKIYLFLTDRRTDWKPKVLLAVAVAYLLWPIDLIPDFVPFLGWLDDIGVGTLAIWYVSWMARKYDQIQDRNERR